MVCNNRRNNSGRSKLCFPGNGVPYCRHINKFNSTVQHRLQPKNSWPRGTVAHLQSGLSLMPSFSYKSLLSLIFLEVNCSSMNLFSFFPFFSPLLFLLQRSTSQPTNITNNQSSKSEEFRGVRGRGRVPLPPPLLLRYFSLCPSHEHIIEGLPPRKSTPHQSTAGQETPYQLQLILSGDHQK